MRSSARPSFSYSSFETAVGGCEIVMSATSSRRKQQAPRRINADPAHINTPSTVADQLDIIDERSTDSHICGKCCQKFTDLSCYLLHKSTCTATTTPILLQTAIQNSNQVQDEDLTVSHSNNPIPTQINDQCVEVQEMSISALQQQHMRLIQRLSKRLPIDSTLLPSSALITPPNSNETTGEDANDRMHDRSVFESSNNLPCEHCKIYFATEAALQWHCMQEHSEGNPFNCQDCFMVFVSMDAMKDHVKVHHAANVLCRDRADSTGNVSHAAIDLGRHSVPILQSFNANIEDEGSDLTLGSESQSTNPTSERRTGEIQPLDLTITNGALDHVFEQSHLEQNQSLLNGPLAMPSMRMSRGPSMRLPMSSLPENRLLDPPVGEDWEHMMEVSETDETEKIRQLVGDAPYPPTTDPNQCLICRRILSCKSALQMHYRTHTGDRPYRCKLCQRSFTTKGNLKTHMGVHRIKQSFRTCHQCPICQKRVLTESLLHQHIRLHTAYLSASRTGYSRVKFEESSGPEPLMPNLTPQKLVEETNKDVAPVEHPMLSRLTVDESSPKLKNENGTQMALLPFQGHNPFAPVMSPAVTSHNMALTSMKSNTTCNVCLKTFACNSALEIHYRSHTKVRPFKCDLCGRGFSTKGNMKQHYLTHKIRGEASSNGTQNDSPSLTPTSSRNGGRSSREMSSTPPLYSAEHLNKMSLGQQPAVYQVEPPTAFECDQKPRDQPLMGAEDPLMTSSNGPSPLESIQRMWAKTDSAPPTQPDQSIALGKHQCGVCLKHFSSSSALQIHMRTHTGDKPFKCTVCQRAFTTKGNLKVHMVTHMWNNPGRRGRRIFELPPDGRHAFETGLMTGIFNVNQTGVRPSAGEPYSKGADLPPAAPTAASSDSLTASSAASHYTQQLFLNSALSFPQAPSVPFMPPHPFLPHGLLNSPLEVASFVQNAPFDFNGQQPSMETMMLLWRTVCSVCQKQCSSSTELEEHLKEHLESPASKISADKSTTV